MGEVTIDASDLEALLLAAGAANASPKAKEILKQDVQFEQVMAKLSDALDNASRAWRKAQRAAEFPGRLKVEQHEVAYLIKMHKEGAGQRMGIFETVPVPRSYISKGLIELGVYSENIAWANSHPVTHQHVQRRVRLTSDAIQIVAMALSLEKETPAPARTHEQDEPGQGQGQVQVLAIFEHLKLDAAQQQ